MSKIRIFSLGGLNENGKNMYVVEVDNDIFVFDAGLKYADDKLFGIDYILPNYDYIKEKGEVIGEYQVVSAKLVLNEEKDPENSLIDIYFSIGTDKGENACEFWESF